MNLPSILPERASTLADQFEILFWYITIITTVVGLAVYAFMLYCCVKYRRANTNGSTPRILGSARLELAWTIIPLLVFLTFFAGGAFVFNYYAHAPKDAMEVFVIGKQWMWKAEYPNGQRLIIGGNPRNMSESERESIGALVLPVNRPVKLTFISEDVIHNFGVPAFRSKIDVLPGRYTSTWYHPTKTGEYHVFCDQYCGTWHSLMVGRVRVVGEQEFDAWLDGAGTFQGSENPVDGSPAQAGRNQFLRLQCLECHNSESVSKAPLLEEIYGQPREVKVRQPDGSYGPPIEVVADEAYILESIVNPRAKLRVGWETVMPGNFHDLTTAEERNALVQFIRGLKAGQTPKRTDRQNAPVGAPIGPATPGPKTPTSPEKK
jgi:cytochrome c oxidase subunit 2